MIDDELPMGREFECSLGKFILPSQILAVQIENDVICFTCEEDRYIIQADQKVKMKIVKQSRKIGK